MKVEKRVESGNGQSDNTSEASMENVLMDSPEITSEVFDGADKRERKSSERLEDYELPSSESDSSDAEKEEEEVYDNAPKEGEDLVEYFVRLERNNFKGDRVQMYREHFVKRYSNMIDELNKTRMELANEESIARNIGDGKRNYSKTSNECEVSTFIAESSDAKEEVKKVDDTLKNKFEETTSHELPKEYARFTLPTCECRVTEERLVPTKYPTDYEDEEIEKDSELKENDSHDEADNGKIKNDNKKKIKEDNKKVKRKDNKKEKRRTCKVKMCKVKIEDLIDYIIIPIVLLVTLFLFTMTVIIWCRSEPRVEYTKKLLANFGADEHSVVLHLLFKEESRNDWLSQFTIESHPCIFLLAPSYLEIFAKLQRAQDFEGKLKEASIRCEFLTRLTSEAKQQKQHVENLNEMRSIELEDVKQFQRKFHEIVAAQSEEINALKKGNAELKKAINSLELHECATEANMIDDEIFYNNTKTTTQSLLPPPSPPKRKKACKMAHLCALKFAGRVRKIFEKLKHFAEKTTEQLARRYV